MSESNANLATIWEGIADAIPQQTALVHGDRRISWGEFDRRASSLAAALLEAGIGPGTTVAIDLYNCPEWLEVFFAAIKIRAVPANVNYRYLDQELCHLLADAQAGAIVFHASLTERIMKLREQLPEMRLYVQVSDEGLAASAMADHVHDYETLVAAFAPAARMERFPEDQFLSYTGGTTGLPKGVMVSLGRVIGNIAFLGPMMALDADQLANPVGTASDLARKGQSLVAVPASPLMHSTGLLMAALPTLTFGGTVVTLVSISFSPEELLETAERERAALITFVGDAIARPVLNALREASERGRRYDLSSLKLISSAGVGWSAEAKNGLFEFLPGAQLLDGCGASEGCSYGYRVYRKGDQTSGTNFTAAPGLLVLDESGRPQPAKPGMSGLLANTTSATAYYNDPVKSAQNFRLIDGVMYAIPGDYGRIEADSSLTLVGRGSTTINTGGEKVHPEEVEDVLKEVIGVDDCIVLGLPDERWGQRVIVLVQCRPRTLVEAQDLIAHARGRLAAYKAPKQVYFVDEVPRAPNGKPNYSRARELAAQLSAAH